MSNPKKAKPFLINRRQKGMRVNKPKLKYNPNMNQRLISLRLLSQNPSIKKASKSKLKKPQLSMQLRRDHRKNRRLLLKPLKKKPKPKKLNKKSQIWNKSRTENQLTT